MAEEGFISIEVEGVERLEAAIRRYPKQAATHLAAAGVEAAERVILPTRGLRSYPPFTAANRPPTPYYIRGIGTQYKTRNLKNSENLGKKFYVRSEPGGYRTRIGNTASYAKWVVGEEQARAMERIGWRKLREVAQERIPQIASVYNAWIARLLRAVGLS